MSGFQTAIVDFDAAHRHVALIKASVENIQKCTRRAVEALDTAAETNTMDSLGVVQQCFLKVEERIVEVPPATDGIDMTINKYRDEYESEINARNAGGDFEAMKGGI